MSCYFNQVLYGFGELRQDMIKPHLLVKDEARYETTKIWYPYFKVTTNIALYIV
jgi:hypothetical protein